MKWLYMNRVRKGERWIGFSVDERRRIKRFLKSERTDGWRYRFPLSELMLDKSQCIRHQAIWGRAAHKLVLDVPT